MESYGEILRNAREEKNVTVSDVSRITQISNAYIEALEEERVEVFPGEPYFIGFLTNYCEYLELNRDEILDLYRAKKIQETPTPIELLQKKKPKYLIPLIVSLLVAVIVGIGIYLYVGVFQIPQKRELEKLESQKNQKIHQYKFTGKPETKRFYKGDQILFPQLDGNGNITLTIGSTLGSLTILTPSGNQIVELSEERALDLDGNGSPDLIVYLSDVSTDDEQYGAEIRLLGTASDSSAVEVSSAEPAASGQDIVKNATVKNSGKRTVVHEDNRAYPFTVILTFRGPCLCRYKIDRQQNVESYYRNGDVITLSANNGTRLWMSNINTVKIQVVAGLSSYDLEVGRAGEVQVEDIKWVRDNDGRYRLVVLEVD